MRESTSLSPESIECHSRRYLTLDACYRIDSATAILAGVVFLLAIFLFQSPPPKGSRLFFHSSHDSNERQHRLMRQTLRRHILQKYSECNMP